MKKINDLHITETKPLISPKELKKQFPLTNKSKNTVVEGREQIIDILNKKDRRLIVITGPCSIHNIESAIEYAQKLNKLRMRIQDRMFIVMRVYFEKPRTTIGWKGFITDPYLNGTYDIATGLRLARKLLLDITALGIPCGSEMLDPVIPQYIADIISWAAIGARTTESQTHRELASGLSMPVGFKNATSGNIKTAVNAMESSMHPHSFIGIDKEGKTSILKTSGNINSHIILRGGQTGPNYYEENIEETEAIISNLGISPSIIVDCSHANSGKKFKKQKRVLRSLLDQKIRGRDSIVGFMLESNLKEGCQKISDSLEYGKSITDECISWEETEELLLYSYEMLGK